MLESVLLNCTVENYLGNEYSFNLITVIIF